MNSLYCYDGKKILLLIISFAVVMSGAVYKNACVGDVVQMNIAGLCSRYSGTSEKELV